MPFTAEQFFDVFVRYHAGVWPAPVVLTALAVLALVLVFKPTDRWVAAIRIRPSQQKHGRGKS